LHSNEKGGYELCALAAICLLFDFLGLLAVVVETEVGDEPFGHDAGAGGKVRQKA
jgi:hypothetical protein